MSLAKTRTLNAGISRLIQKGEKSLKFITLHLPHCFFLVKVLLRECHSEYFGIYSSWYNHQMHFQVVHSYQKNAKSRVCQSQVCNFIYAQLIHVPLNTAMWICVTLHSAAVISASIYLLKHTNQLMATLFTLNHVTNSKN